MSASRTLPYFRRLARGMVVLAICLSLGLQWAALQGIAWTGMLISFSKEGSLIEAMEKTFDGAHPCSLCKAVEAGGKKDQNTAVKSPLKKMEALVVRASLLIAPSASRMTYPVFCVRMVERSTPPPGKPPRAVMA